MKAAGRTSIFSNRIPRCKIASRLKVSPQWLEKAVRLLGMGNGHHGKRQFFTPEQVEVLRTAMLLRACNISWDDICAARSLQLQGGSSGEQLSDTVSEQVALLRSEVQQRVEFLIAELGKFKNKRIQLATSAEAAPVQVVA